MQGAEKQLNRQRKRTRFLLSSIPISCFAAFLGAKQFSASFSFALWGWTALLFVVGFAYRLAAEVLYAC